MSDPIMEEAASVVEALEPITDKIVREIIEEAGKVGGHHACAVCTLSIMVSARLFAFLLFRKHIPEEMFQQHVRDLPAATRHEVNVQRAAAEQPEQG
jgi:hypothetical protein